MSSLPLWQGQRAQNGPSKACFMRAVTPTSPTMAQPAELQAVTGLVAVVEQLVQDVAEDAEVYQQSFPETSSVSLPAISTR